MTATEPAATTDDAEVMGYEAYAQLAKILLPSSGCLAIYAIDGDMAWCSDGFERPDFRELVEEVMAAESSPAATAGTVRETSAGVSALVSRLADTSGTALGYALIELGAGQSNRIGSLATSLTRPLFACLASQLALEKPAEPRSEAPAKEPVSEMRLEFLLGVGQIDLGNPLAIRDLLKLCVERLDCVCAVFCVPDMNLTELAERDGVRDENARTRLDSTRRHLLAWVQLNNRPMVVNRIDTEKAPYKILSCPAGGQNGSATGLLALFRAADSANFELDDVRLIEFISHQAMSLLRERQDSLSGLLSRSAFERIIDEALVAARNRGSLLYIDVDELKSINESFGYPVGDEVIRRIAQLITRAMTDFEIACRVAGDRFVVYTPERNPEEALSLGEELATSASSLGYECDGQTVPVGLSVGAAPPPPAGLGSRHWIAAAELACQQSRERTRQSL